MFLGDTKKPSFKVNKNDDYNACTSLQFLLDNIHLNIKIKLYGHRFITTVAIKNLKDFNIKLVHENKDFLFMNQKNST